jgi:hypothetical protein
VRPPTKEVDFTRVIRRAEAARVAHRTATVATSLTGLALVAYLITASPVVLAAVVLGVLVAVLAVAVRLRLSAAPIPHRES